MGKEEEEKKNLSRIIMQETWKKHRFNSGRLINQSIKFFFALIIVVVIIIIIIKNSNYCRNWTLFYYYWIFVLPDIHSFIHNTMTLI